MYAVILTPRTGASTILPDPFTSFSAAQQAANVEAAARADLVGVEIHQEVNGRWVMQWERNLWQERKDGKA